MPSLMCLWAMCFAGLQLFRIKHLRVVLRDGFWAHRVPWTTRCATAARVAISQPLMGSEDT
jgi:hypothetical protein